MRTFFAKAARKHRVGRASVFHVLSTAALVETTDPDGTVRRSWVGVDERGRELEIVAVVKADRATGEPIMLVIHVMPTALREGPK